MRLIRPYRGILGGVNMDFIDKQLRKYEYMRNPKKGEEDIKEFIDTFRLLSDLISNTETLKNIQSFDLIDLVCHLKEFNNNVKPLIIKYAILLNLINMNKEE